MSIKGSVGAKKANGQRSENNPDDVIYVRVWLNRHILWNPLFKNNGFKKELSTIIATADEEETIRAIKLFQMYILKIQQPSGRIDPGSKTMEALEFSGGNPGYLMPDDFAPTDEQLRDKLYRIRHSAVLAVLADYTPVRLGEYYRLLDMLIDNPDADDTYLRHSYFEGGTRNADYRLKNYIEKCEPNEYPKPIDFAVSLRIRLKNDIETLNNDKKAVKFIKSIVDEIYSGFTNFRTFEAEFALYLDSSLYGRYAAAKNVDNWFQERFHNKNSIYSCLNVHIQTKSVDPISDWTGYWKGTGDMLNPFN